MSAGKIKTANLLVELFVEELPPKALKNLGEAFANQLLDGLQSRGLVGREEKVTTYASPRRMAVHVCNVLVAAPDLEIKEKLLPVSIGLDSENKPTDALRKRLAKLGRSDLGDLWPHAIVGSDKLFIASDGKVDVLFLSSLAKGSSLQVGLEAALEDALEKLPIPKMMTYPNPSGDGWDTVNFVRPAHGLLALHGSDILPISVLGLHAGRVTQGHRFEARISPLSITSADSYAQQLKDDGAVIASFAERRAEIVRQLHAAAEPLGLKPVEDDALLDEVTALVERPNVLVGKFEEAYLEVPPECLILTMKANQKYFPLLDRSGKLTNQFLMVSNISPADASAVIQGNERVVRPRLADAKFFFDQDRKKTLESRVPQLSKVVYHNKLGSQGERVERVRVIARWVAEKVDADVYLVDRAAELAKADLLTDMVGEFPELQGIMGSYYARHDGESEFVVKAIADQYLMRLDEFGMPENFISVVLQIADRIESLIGIWGIGLKPTGDKDPYALRRHALSIIRSFNTLNTVSRLKKEKMALEIDELIEYGLSVFDPGVLTGGVAEEVKLFIYERYYNQLVFMGVKPVAAVFANMPPLHEIPGRIDAVRDFAALPESQSLAAANKRVGNILKKTEGTVPTEIDSTRLIEPAEKALSDALMLIKPKADTAFEAGDYTASLQALADLKAPVDAFFDNVMVNADDPALRANRLALLNQLYQTMNRVADISRLAA